MDLVVFYLLASLIFVNASAASIVLIPKAFDSRYSLTVIMTVFLAIASFIAFVSASWTILSGSFGMYCLGLMLDCLFFNGKSTKSRFSYMGIYAIAALGSLIAFAWSFKILFLVTYMGYWGFSYLLSKGYLKSVLVGPKEE